MKVNVLATAESFEDLLQGRTSVIFDVLRATSTIVTALANGCREVIPFETVAEALSYCRDREDVMLGGERGGLRIPGFHLGNSPLEFISEKVKDKTVVITTTNGTRAIQLAARNSPDTLIGCLLNARATAKAVMKLGKDTAFVCAGTKGLFSLEDTIAAGMVIHELINLSVLGDISLESDLAVAACRLALFYSDNPGKAFNEIPHGKNLAAMGFSEDLAFCARVNIYDIAPVYKNGRITIN